MEESTTRRELGLPRSLVVGVSEDEHSNEAVRAGVDLARRLGARVELVHGVHVHTMGVLVSMPPESVAHDPHVPRVREGLRARLEPLLAEAGGGLVLDDILRIGIGHPVAFLLECAAESRADWIVLGRHVRHGVFDLGQTAHAVLARADAGVWMQPAPYRPIRKVLVPMDLSEHSLRALSSARALAAALGATITIVHTHEVSSAPVFEPESGFAGAAALEEVRQASEAAFAECIAGIDFGEVAHSERFEVGPAARVILDLADGHDLIVMGTHGRTGLASTVLGSVARTVMQSARVPVLAVRQPGRRWVLKDPESA